MLAILSRKLVGVHATCLCSLPVNTRLGITCLFEGLRIEPLIWGEHGLAFDMFEFGHPPPNVVTVDIVILTLCCGIEDRVRGLPPLSIVAHVPVY